MSKEHRTETRLAPRRTGMGRQKRASFYATCSCGELHGPSRATLVRAEQDAREHEATFSECEFARVRGGRMCDEYAAPSLWCGECWPRLASERLTPSQRARFPERMTATAESRKPS